MHYFLLCLTGCAQEKPPNDNVSSDDVVSDEVFEGDGIIVPILGEDSGNVLWLERGTGDIQTTWDQSLMHTQVWGDYLIGLNEDVNGANPPVIEQFDFDQALIGEIESISPHHTIAVVDDLLYYISSFKREDDKLIDHVRWVDLLSFDTGVLLDTAEVFDVEAMNLSYQGSDITHANTLYWEPVQELFYLSFAGIDAVWTFDIEGEIDRVFLGRDATPDPYFVDNICFGGQFHHPHGGTGRTSGELWVLSSQEQSSEVQRYQCNEGNLSIDEIYPPPYENFASLAGGNILVGESTVILNWGFVGLVEERDIETQSQLWQLESDLGFGIGFVSWSAKP